MSIPHPAIICAANCIDFPKSSSVTFQLFFFSLTDSPPSLLIAAHADSDTNRQPEQIQWPTALQVSNCHGISSSSWSPGKLLYCCVTQPLLLLHPCANHCCRISQLFQIGRRQGSRHRHRLGHHQLLCGRHGGQTGAGYRERRRIAHHSLACGIHEGE